MKKRAFEKRKQSSILWLELLREGIQSVFATLNFTTDKRESLFMGSNAVDVFITVVDVFILTCVFHFYFSNHSFMTSWLTSTVLRFVYSFHSSPFWL